MEIEAKVILNSGKLPTAETIIDCLDAMPKVVNEAIFDSYYENKHGKLRVRWNKTTSSEENITITKKVRKIIDNVECNEEYEFSMSKEAFDNFFSFLIQDAKYKLYDRKEKKYTRFTAVKVVEGTSIPLCIDVGVAGSQSSPTMLPYIEIETISADSPELRAKCVEAVKQSFSSLGFHSSELDSRRWREIFKEKEKCK